jgi:nitroimidazol reductase NimA-like FMN-containing flavoprotein (pyridoxamine 5'-phosphate oxidase superfamily)
MSEQYAVTETTRLKRLAKRGCYDVETVHRILDEAMVCHVATIIGGRPRVLPTLHWRIGDRLFIHGARKNGMFQAMRDGQEASVAVTLVDGLVLARSAFHHSVNYRSVVAFGKFAEITDEKEHFEALEAMMGKFHPGRWAEVRWPNEVEMAQTATLAMPLVEVSAKIRTGPPVDDEEDYALPVWAGIVPLALQRGQPIPDEGVSGSPSSP